MSDAGTGVRKPPLPSTGAVLHQQRNFGKRPAALAVCGFALVATIGYFTFWTKSSPGTGSSEVAKVAAGVPPK